MDQKIDIEFLKKLRGGRTQEDVAFSLGISRQYYSYIESGERVPSLKVLAKIAKYYRKPIGKFFLPENATKCCN